MVTSFPQSFHYRSNKQNIYLHLNSANAPQCGLTVFSPFREIISNNCSIPLWWKLNTCSYLTTAWMPSLRPIFPHVNFCQMIMEFGPSAKVMILSILCTGPQASCKMIGEYFNIITLGTAITIPTIFAIYLLSLVLCWWFPSFFYYLIFRNMSTHGLASISDLLYFFSGLILRLIYVNKFFTSKLYAKSKR